jgi:hypothetical protein
VTTIGHEQSWSSADNTDEIRAWSLIGEPGTLLDWRLGVRMKGFVYIISNPSLPGLVKVGYSMKDPGFRVKNDFDPAGLPDDYVIEYFALVDDPRDVEGRVHDILKSQNCHHKKEWFRAAPIEVVSVLRGVADNIFWEYDEKLPSPELQKFICQGGIADKTILDLTPVVDMTPEEYRELAERSLDLCRKNSEEAKERKRAAQSNHRNSMILWGQWSEDDEVRWQAKEKELTAALARTTSWDKKQQENLRKWTGLSDKPIRERESGSPSSPNICIALKTVDEENSDQ